MSAADDDMPPTAFMIASAIVTSPIWVPPLAVYGAFHGIKAAFTHGIVPGMKKLAAASRKK